MNIPNISPETLASLDRFRSRGPVVPEPGSEHGPAIVIGSGPAKLSVAGEQNPLLVENILYYPKDFGQGPLIQAWDGDRFRRFSVEGDLAETGKGISWTSYPETEVLLSPVEASDYDLWFARFKKEPSLDELDDAIWERGQGEPFVNDRPAIKEHWVYLQEDGTGEVVMVARYTDRSFSVLGKPGTKYEEEARLAREVYEGFPPEVAWRRYARPHDMGAGNLRGTILKATPENEAKVTEVFSQWRANG
jgi:hypothetical protein